jgi:hypothetical protein
VNVKVSRIAIVRQNRMVGLLSYFLVTSIALLCQTIIKRHPRNAISHPFRGPIIEIFVFA